MAANLNVIYYFICTRLGLILYVFVLSYGFLLSWPGDTHPLQAFSLLISLYLTGTTIITWFIFRVGALRTFYQNELGKDYIHGLRQLWQSHHSCIGNPGYKPFFTVVVGLGAVTGADLLVRYGDQVIHKKSLAEVDLNVGRKQDSAREFLKISKEEYKELYPDNPEKYREQVENAQKTFDPLWGKAQEAGHAERERLSIRYDKSSRSLISRLERAVLEIDKNQSLRSFSHLGRKDGGGGGTFGGWGKDGPGLSCSASIIQQDPLPFSLFPSGFFDNFLDQLIGSTDKEWDQLFDFFYSLAKRFK